jgi:ribose transport system permease protein
VDVEGIRRIWRLDPNWTFVIIGSVILAAVILDQAVHIVQDKRRIKRAAAEANAAASGTNATASGPAPSS